MLAQHQEHTSRKGGAGPGTQRGKAQDWRRGGSTDEGVPHRFVGRFSARLLEGRRTTLGWQNDPACNDRESERDEKILLLLYYDVDLFDPPRVRTDRTDLHGRCMVSLALHAVAAVAGRVAYIYLGPWPRGQGRQWGRTVFVFFI